MIIFWALQHFLFFSLSPLQGTKCDNKKKPKKKREDVWDGTKEWIWTPKRFYRYTDIDKRPVKENKEGPLCALAETNSVEPFKRGHYLFKPVYMREQRRILPHSFNPSFLYRKVGKPPAPQRTPSNKDTFAPVLAPCTGHCCFHCQRVALFPGKLVLFRLSRMIELNQGEDNQNKQAVRRCSRTPFACRHLLRD